MPIEDKITEIFVMEDGFCKVFNAMRFICLNGLLVSYYERIEKLIDSVSDCEWGLYDTLQDIYSEYW